MLIEMSYGGVATENTASKGQQFTREYQLPVDDVQQCHVHLETPHGVVGALDSSNPGC